MRRVLYPQICLRQNLRDILISLSWIVLNLRHQASNSIIITSSIISNVKVSSRLILKPQREPERRLQWDPQSELALESEGKIPSCQVSSRFVRLTMSIRGRALAPGRETDHPQFAHGLSPILVSRFVTIIRAQGVGVRPRTRVVQNSMGGDTISVRHRQRWIELVFMRELQEL